MERNYANLVKSVSHLQILNKVFSERSSYSEKRDWEIYNENNESLSKIISSPDIELYNQLYHEKNRQMILADILEYILLGRGYYILASGSLKAKERKMGKFIELILRFVNILMSYETITVDVKLRKNFLKGLKGQIAEIAEEEQFNSLLNFNEEIGLPLGEDASPELKKINKYFDGILPKTAGGLWHELLVFIFLIRHNLGFVAPLLLHQRLLSGSGALVPPDFLIITQDKDIYGVEVGTKKEIQSGSFSLSTNIPTATVDTINSRSSDRCPICKRWIQFCEKVIRDFSDRTKKLPPSMKINCLKDCDVKGYTKAKISRGECPYAKYSRRRAESLKYSHIPQANGLHYHYQCVLASISKKQGKLLMESQDATALKTHYPYYSGLEMLFHGH